VTIVNPAPVVSAISPATVNAGSGNTKLKVTGTGFCAQSVVQLGGTALATLYINPTVLTAVAPAAQLTNAGSLAVDVTTSAPGGGTSSALILAVQIVNPAPIISSISPAAVSALSGVTVVTVTGSGFIPQSTLSVNGSAFPATVVSSTELTASLSALMVAQPAAFNLVVSNPAPGGGTSAPATFTVLAQGSVTPTGNPQVALYSFSAPRDASVSIEFGTDTTYGKSTWVRSTPPGGGAVQILVAGMLANTTYHMRADVSFPDGTQFVDTDHTFTTGSLPAAMVPQITVTNPSGLSPTPGAIFLHLSGPGGPGVPTNKIRLVAVDTAGNVIWYYNPPVPGNWLANPIKLLPNGHVLVNMSLPTGAQPFLPSIVQEIDLAGNVISQFSNTDVTNWLNAAGYNLTAASFCRDILPLPNGHLILIIWHVTNCQNITGCTAGNIPVYVDALVDLDENRKPVWVWDMLDHTCEVTPNVPCVDINRHFAGFPDWTHANALAYSADDGNLLLSLRHELWVLKIDYQDGQGSGDILWRLGAKGEFTLMNGGVVDENMDDWFYAQHYVTILSPNSTGVFQLGVFDNGNIRGVFDTPSNPCPPSLPSNCYSRVPIFQVDEVGKTANIIWQDNLSPVYSDWAGTLQLLNNDSRVAFTLGSPSDDPLGSRYMEVTHDPTPITVFQMEISNQCAYRMVHYPSLYPGVQW
jgi:hypothetical protein